MGSVIIITPGGERVADQPVERVTAGGIPIEGMKGVEDIGWFDATHVFATGEVNPYLMEYRTIDIWSGKIGGLGGGGFSTCSKESKVAYWGPVYPPSTAMPLKTSKSKAALYTFPDENALPTIHIHLQWADGCNYLGFIDPRSPSALMIFRENAMKKVALPQDGDEVTNLVGIREGFLVGKNSELLYNVLTATLSQTPADVLSRVKTRQGQQRKTEDSLSGSQQDWWWPGGL